MGVTQREFGIRKSELKNFLREKKGYIPFTPYEKISLVDCIKLA